MNKVTRRWSLACCVVALGLGTAALMPQARAAGNDLQDMTPIYHEILDAQRKLLTVTNDAEWAAVSPKLLRVVQLKLEAHTIAVRSLFAGTYIAGMGGGSTTLDSLRRIEVIHGVLPSVPYEEEDALQKALADGAPMAEINTAVAKVEAVRRQREADMSKAQSELRKVLTPKQAAALVAGGMLN